MLRNDLIKYLLLFIINHSMTGKYIKIDNYMEEKKFGMFLVPIVPDVVEIITKNYGLDEISASKKFYESKAYSLLEEETKIWYLSYD